MTTAAPGLQAGTRPALRALRQRLGSAAAALGVGGPDPAGSPADDASDLLGRLVERLHAVPSAEEVWLVWTALSSSLPDHEDVQAALRALALADRPDDFAAWLLESCWGPASSTGDPDLEMDVVVGAVVVDVDFTARNDLHTGIQRVVRETVPRWSRDQDLVLVAWTSSGGAYRRLVGHEPDRVLRWGSGTPGPGTSAGPPEPHRLVVPWRCTVVLLENPAPDHCPALAALARHSGSTLGLVGYDLIPAISPELIHEGLPDRFMRYLLAVKHAHRVAGISAAAAGEFRGFTEMLGAQGLTGPSVEECILPVEVPPGEARPTSPSPLVVSIGSFEPRKNQLAVLHAAESLWREGLDFTVEFIGGGGWATEFDSTLARLQRAGRPARRRTAVPDEDLWSTVRSARFTVFVSLHEGYGLPVAESLACGVPCLTSDRGSTKEIADGGGALTVDPMDDRQIATMMRRLLTDDALIADLRRAASSRPRRTWDDYATDLWATLVSPAAAS